MRLVRVRRGSVVLDVCTGLGYAAIAAARAGAGTVVSVELQPGVIEVARQNPLSADLFTLSQVGTRGDGWGQGEGGTCSLARSKGFEVQLPRYRVR